MAATIQLKEKQKLILGLFALAHKFGKVELDEEDNTPRLRFDMPISPEVREMAFRHVGSVWVSLDRLTVSMHRFNEDLFGPDVNPTHPFQLVEWALCGTARETTSNPDGWFPTGDFGWRRLRISETCREMTLTDAHLVNEALREQDINEPRKDSRRARWLLPEEIEFDQAASESILWVPDRRFGDNES